jgi:hypothetical protein
MTKNILPAPLIWRALKYTGGSMFLIMQPIFFGTIAKQAFQHCAMHNAGRPAGQLLPR